MSTGNTSTAPVTTPQQLARIAGFIWGIADDVLRDLALMEAALREARNRGAETMEIGVDEPDHVARQLYESLGFSNRSGGSEGPLMYMYEGELRS